MDIYIYISICVCVCVCACVSVCVSVFLLESPSGALNENTNGSSQISASRSGWWCEVEKCGFLRASQKWSWIGLPKVISPGG